MINLYRILTNFIYPFLIIIIYLRKILKKEDELRFREKIFSNFFDCKRNSNKKLVWFHAASIGEVQSIFPVIDELKKKNKNLEFLITTVTVSSGNLVQQKINSTKDIIHRYFPVDINFLIKEFLNKWKPSLVLFVDSEVWPNLIFEIKKRNIPMILINGRITKKTFSKWMLISEFAKKIFEKFDLSLASSKESEKNLEKLGVKNLKYIGNIKFAVKIKKDILLNKNFEFLNNKKFWCAASTHKGEEEMCLKTHIQIKKRYKEIITVIVPRHINRSKEIFHLCNKYFLSSQILSNGELIEKNKEIIIVNSFGALLKLYKLSKCVFIGKSTLKVLEHAGGQNPIEAAKLGCKIYHGPYNYNFKEIYELLGSLKISEKINNENDLANKIINDLDIIKKEHNLTINNIDELGQKILDKSITEINKFISQ